MILDRIENAGRYYSLHPGFQTAFDFLKNADLNSMEPGRHEVDGSRIFIIILKDKGKGIDNTKLENHQRYIDIQCVISGTDLIGWKNLSDCGGLGQGYDEEKDIEFFESKADIWITTPPGHFCLFFPEDAHAPMGSEDELFKVIIKIAVE